MSKAPRWSTEQLQAYEQRRGSVRQALRLQESESGGRSKYRNQKTESGGILFDSKAEALRWHELQMLEAAGKIANLVRQVTFSLAPAVRLEGEERKKPALRYVADFIYVEDGRLIVEDVKSTITRATRAYRQKRHLMKTVHDLDIRETMKG